MHTPAAIPIALARRHRAILGTHSGQADQWFDALGHVAHFRQPVVHLGVDVGRVAAVPGGVDLVGPDALKVGGFRAGPTAGDHQISRVLEEERKHRRLPGLGELLQSLVGGQIRGCCAAKINLDTVEQAPVRFDVAIAHRRVTLFGYRIKISLATNGGVDAFLAGRFAEAVEAAVRGQQQHRFVGAADVHSPFVRLHAAAGEAHLNPGLERHPPSVGRLRVEDVAVGVQSLFWIAVAVEKQRILALIAHPLDLSESAIGSPHRQLRGESDAVLTGGCLLREFVRRVQRNSE